jgi:hypothetical protein
MTSIRRCVVRSRHGRELHPDRATFYCSSRDVGKQLKEWPTKSDVLRVAMGLRKLEREGRIRVTTRAPSGGGSSKEASLMADTPERKYEGNLPGRPSY